MSSPRRPFWIICALAALHGLFFIWYQRPDWTIARAWPDQDGYRRLGQVLATTGKFTRFPDAPAFVPEVLRTPAYPLFVAAIYKLFGTAQLPIALAQTAIFVAICALVYAIARQLVPESVAVVAAALTAAYAPIPYFGALVMTEVWTTLLFTLSMLLVMRGYRCGRMRDFALLGVALGATALSRPAFALFPVALTAVGVVLLPIFRVRARPSVSRWAVMLITFGVTMLPWFTYNYATLGVFTLSPAGGVGRGLWEGSWQATWSGRVQDELTQLADSIDDRAELDRRVQAVADREHLSAQPMLDYVHQWEDIRVIWTEPVDSAARAKARIAADREYLRVGLDNVGRDPLPHMVRRLSRGVFLLWAGEIPFRYTDINTLPPALIYACWAAQAALVALALAGAAALARRGQMGAAWLLAAPLIYITAVHLPLLKEARQSLPAQPIVMLLAAIGLASLSGRSLAGEPQVHERQHL